MSQVFFKQVCQCGSDQIDQAKTRFAMFDTQTSVTSQKFRPSLSAQLVFLPQKRPGVQFLQQEDFGEGHICHGTTMGFGRSMHAPSAPWPGAIASCGATG